MIRSLPCLDAPPSTPHTSCPLPPYPTPPSTPTPPHPQTPPARHKDFYDGHSWASGLFSQNNGKSQESSSEAINAYYGAHLFGRATGDRRLEKFARLLLAMEIRSTKAYWHMRNATTMYDPDFAANKMVGVVGGLDATCHTWFGEKFEFVVRGVGSGSGWVGFVGVVQ